MLLNSWPIRFLITRAARANGFLDPVNLVAKIRQFAEPSEFAEPLELLRAGMLFHARGLVNTKAIQNNLDWVWPYWVERQFNPADESFIPRAFSFSHINLTHRNWTAVGVPDVPYYPIVDPRGLVTPLFDGWSLDFWIVLPNGALLLPAKLRDFHQTLTLDSADGAGDQALRVRSRGQWPEATLETEVTLCLHNHEPHCCILVRVTGAAAGHVAVSLRPYNPEGISFVEKLALAADGCGWRINGRNSVLFDRAPTRMILSTYGQGDASHRLTDPTSPLTVADPVGMATAVALFDVQSVREHPLDLRAPIYNELDPKKRPSIAQTPTWATALAPLAKLRLADPKVQTLFDLAVANLVLHSPDEAYPGPYTYKRFWFRDAAFILHALLALGAVDRTRRVLRHFAPRQRRDGYFLSQEGEWDSNGEALWAYWRFLDVTGEPLPEEWRRAVRKGARWITRKRLPRDSGRPEAGLLPAGFSAEHLGPNDFYYWDDFWAVAGLRAAAVLLRETEPEYADRCEHEAAEFLQTIERSFPTGPQRRFPGAIPASPKRRMDSGAVGSLAADYPLQLFPPGDERILKTANYLRDHSSFAGGFFQNMIHSGINAYLTLHLAQIRLRAGDVGAAWSLMDTVAGLASPTGQWPEAIHPATRGGCMGDGEHIWAAAEWVLMVRNCFVREEGERLIIGSGLRPEWWRSGATLERTLTSFGAVTVRIEARDPLARARSHDGEAVRVIIEAKWRRRPRLEVRLPGFAVQQRAAETEREVFELTPAAGRSGASPAAVEPTPEPAHRDAGK
jgi:hypothetical protein